MENLTINLTELEELTLKTLIDNLYEEGYSDVDVNDISRILKIETKILRGVISSLVKKGIVFVHSNEDYDLIYLHEKFYFLHPNF